MQEQIKRLRETRQKAWEEAKALNDTVQAESRDFNAEEESTWDRLNGEIDTADKRITQLLDIVEREREADEARERFERVARPEPGANPDEVKDDDLTKMRRLIAGEDRAVEFSGSRDQRDLTVGAPTGGGNTVPIGFLPQLYQHLIEVSAIRQTNVTVLTTDSGEALRIPKTTAHGGGAIVAEAAAIAEADPTFGQVTLDAFKYGVLIQVSNELITDTAVDLLGYLAMQAGRALGNASGGHFVTGTGASQPNGAVTASSLGVTAALNSAVTFDEIINLFFSVISPYRANAWFMMKDSTLGAIRKLKDTTGQYLWQPSLQIGEPDAILGRPLVVDPNMAAIGTVAKSVLFGDFSAYYIRDVNAVRFERSDDFAFANDLVTFRALLRTDGDLVDTTGAVKHLVHPA